jgi:hypothetical protein
MTERQSRVYVVQRPAYWNRKTNDWQDKYDLSAAKEHGALVYLLPPGNISNNLTETMARLKHRLIDYTLGDHLLAVGDPVAIAAATMVASYFTDGNISMLKWDRFDNKYHPYLIAFPTMAA